MKRSTFVALSTLVLSAAFASTAYAKPPSGDSNPSDLHNATVDTSRVIDPHSK